MEIEKCVGNDESVNNVSILMKFVYGRSKYLTGGDLYIEMEEKLAEQYGDLLKADVMKSNHHGDYESMTIRAEKALKECSVIVGYTVYVELIEEFFPGKEFLTTPMRQEKERCRMAFSEAEKGKTTAMICSGDAGVYGMAGLIYEIGTEFPEVEIEIVPGITAALSGAALLGAPLTHDFAVISLSDLLTPWEKIEKRLLAAAEADFSICLYNPASKKRADYLRRACELLLKSRPAETVCGIVRNIGRDGEEKKLMSLGELRDYEADMFTTVFIGNSQTFLEGRDSQVMVTPRGYRL